MWTALTFMSVPAVLFGPKVMCQVVESVTVALAAFMTLGLIFVAFQAGTLDALSKMARGWLNVGYIELGDELSFTRFSPLSYLLWQVEATTCFMHFNCATKASA